MSEVLAAALEDALLASLLEPRFQLYLISFANNDQAAGYHE